MSLHLHTSVECSAEDRLYLDTLPEVTFESEMGYGGKILHLVDQIFHPDLDCKDLDNHMSKFQSAIAPYRKFVDMMLEKFKSSLPNVKILDYSLEPRKYIFQKQSKEDFVGEIHDDGSEYTVIWYYRIDSEILDKGLGLFESAWQEEMPHQTISIRQNDLIIISGHHGVLGLNSSTIPAQRNIFALFINGHP